MTQMCYNPHINKLPVATLKRPPALRNMRFHSMSNDTIKCDKCGSTQRWPSGGCIPCGRESNRRFRAANPGYQRKWRQSNREKCNTITLKYRSANRELMRKRDNAWKKAHPEITRAQWQRRRARKKNIESEYYDFKAICAHYNNHCVKCGEQKPLTVDHIMPISKGGPDIASNIQPLCLSCNSSKGARHIDYRPDAGPERWFQIKLII